MVYILSLYASILALAVWQEGNGSGHSEGDLGSERHGRRCTNH